jgi:hypothetical protein
MTDALILTSRNSTLLFLGGIGVTYDEISQEQIDQMQEKAMQSEQ